MRDIKKIMYAVAIIVTTVCILQFSLFPKEAKSIQTTEYQTYVVGQGDTYWSIATKLQPYWGQDVREIVWELEHYNNISPGTLQIGQKLKIPYKCDVVFLESKELILAKGQ